MLTVIGIPKPFGGVHDTIQENAIRSWQELPCDKEILLMGESSCAPIAQEVGAQLVTDFESDAFGTPLVSSVLAKAHEYGKGDLLCLVNSDIIVLPELAAAIDVVQSELDRFLLVARRWNVDLTERVSFAPGWDRRLRKVAVEKGVLFAPQAIDIFVFPRGLFGDIPPFAIGRSYYDNWFIDRARRRGAAVVNATDRCTLVHQNHVYTNFRSIKDIRESPQGRRNFYLAGDSYIHIATTRDATHLLTTDGLQPTETRTVSVVIPHRGPLWRLHAAIRALTHQTYPRTFIEIVVAHNDPDGTIGGLQVQYPFVKVCTQPRPGPAAARNCGAACASGEVLAFLDSDCVPTSGWIAAGVDELLTVASGTGVVAGEIEHRFASERRSVAEAYDAVTFLQQKRYVEENSACVTANMFVTREHFWRLGGFDESFEEASGEDWEWSGRARAAGTTIHYSPTAKVFHPALRTVADLRKKLRRVARGNALQWCRLVASGEADPARLAAVGPPSLGKLRRRVRRLWRDERLSRAERWKAAAVLATTWPSLRREWRRVAAKAQRKADV